MIQLDSASQDNASAAEDVSKAASEAQHQSSKMLDVVSEMELFMFGLGYKEEVKKVVSKPVVKPAPLAAAKGNLKVESLPKIDLKPQTQSDAVKKFELAHAQQHSEPQAMEKPSNVIELKDKKPVLNMGKEPTDNKIKKIENF